MIVIPFLFLLIYILSINIKYKEYYKIKLDNKVNHIIYGSSAPRGRILDRNGIVIVDNKQINNLVFHYTKGINVLYVANRLSKIITVNKPSDNAILKYYKDTNDEYSLLTKKEKDNYRKRFISKDKIENIINDRILNIVNYTDEELNIISIYYIISNNYLYEKKVILEDIDDNLISLILDNNIPGISIESSFKRFYPYGDTLRSILGNVGHITKENILEYKEYDLDDIVGLSYLEKQYENYLKGSKAIYKVNSDYSLTKIKEEEKGNDLYLSIDINLQVKLEEIVKEELILSKKKTSTKYLSDTYSIFSNPNTGEIIAFVGKRYLSNGEFNDIASNNISSSFTVGSIVKGATMAVGLKYNLINPNKKILDSCVKLYSQNPKCSWKSLGYVDAVRALEYSSNYYQFLIALKLMGYDYYSNIKVEANINHFNIYREMLSSFGLGVISQIDLPNEKTGIIGNKISTDLLLNLAIGQYDTYTPVELSSYINTIASNGKRRKLSLVSYIKNNNNEIIFQSDNNTINNVDLSKDNFNIIQNGFINVMKGGTGWGSFNINLKPAGKTGTSETFIDTDNDGIMDTSTTSLAIVGYFPYDNPSYSLIVVSPNVSVNDDIFYISSHVSKKFTNYILENNS